MPLGLRGLLAADLLDQGHDLLLLLLDEQCDFAYLLGMCVPYVAGLQSEALLQLGHLFLLGLECLLVAEPELLDPGCLLLL